jgi:hypothetical protein
VRVGHRQAPNTENPSILDAGVFYCLKFGKCQNHDIAHSDNM